jgi:hypothetical protein
MDHPLVHQTKQGLEVMQRLEEVKSERNRQTLPLTTDMIVVAENRVFRTTSVSDRVKIIAMKMQIVTLFRISEMVKTADDHYLRAQDVSFTIASTTGGIFEVACATVYMYDKKEVQAVTYLVRSAKNDQGGRGFKFHFRTDEVKADAAFNIVTCMFEWAKSARPEGQDMFLSSRKAGQQIQLSYEMYSSAIKATATHLGFNPDLFSTHSGRIGGASMLAAAGHPDHVIQQMGRWKSSAFLKYIRFAIKNMNEAMNSIVSTKYLTSTDIAKIYSGARLDSNASMMGLT